MSLGTESGVSAVMRKSVQDCVGGGRRCVPLQREVQQRSCDPLVCVDRSGINALILAREDGCGSRSGETRLKVQTVNNDVTLIFIVI